MQGYVHFIVMVEIGQNGVDFVGAQTYGTPAKDWEWSVWICGYGEVYAIQERKWAWLQAGGIAALIILSSLTLPVATTGLG
jgi:hypothetical protein